MALTAPVYLHTMGGTTTRIRGIAAASTTFYRGALLVYNTSGLLALPTDAANLVPCGYFTGHNIDPEDSTKLVTLASPPVTIEYEMGLIRVPFSGAAQTDVGELFYLADSGTVTKTAGSKTWAVLCRDFESGFVWLDFRNPIKVA